MPPIWKFGTEEQKQRWLVPGIKGEKIGALGITEPGAGSDVAAHPDHARARWTAATSSTGPRPSSPTASARTSWSAPSRPPQEGGHHGISFLVLERDMPGYEVVAKLEKMGWHASDTGELSFSDVEVPGENLLGEENEGF